MATPAFIVKCIARLIVLKTPSFPVGEAEIEAMQVAWCDEFDDLTDAELQAALRARATGFWPQPPEIRAHAYASRKTVERTPELLWDAIVERCRDPRFRHPETGQFSMSRLLTDEEQALFRSIGGSRKLGACASEWDLKAMRDAWIRAHQGGTVTALRLVDRVAS